MVRYVARYLLTHMNVILANFNHCDFQTKYRLFVSFCTSYNGSCQWDLQLKLVDVFYTTWREAIRGLFELPRHGHCNLVPLVTFSHLESTLSLDIEHLNKYFDYWKLHLNTKKTVATCFHLDNKQAARKPKVTLAGDVLVHDFAPKYLGDRSLTENLQTMCAIKLSHAATSSANWQELTGVHQLLYGRPGLVETVFLILANTRNMLNLQQNASRMSKRMYLGHIYQP